jgi:hypothetical protein
MSSHFWKRFCALQMVSISLREYLGIMIPLCRGDLS